MKPYLILRRQAAAAITTAEGIQAEISAEDCALDDSEIESRATEIQSLVAQTNRLRTRADTLEELDRARIAGEALDDPESGGPDPVADGGVPRVPAIARDPREEGRCGFRSIADFALAVVGQAQMRHDTRLDTLFRPEAAASGMSQGVGSDGGFMVPPSFSQEIWDGLNAMPDNILARCDQIPIEGESLTLIANSETSRATGSRYGGIRGYWLEEAEVITESRPKVRQLKLEPHELGVFAFVTDKLLRNAAALQVYLFRAAMDEINWLSGDAVLNGNGAGKPLGILNSGCLVTVAKESGQAADTFVQGNVAKMWSRLHARARANAVWLINTDVDPQLFLMVTEVKNVAGTENVGGLNARLYNPDTDTLMGRPIIRTEWNKTLGDVGDVIVGDLRFYALGLAARSPQIRDAVSIHLKFDSAQTAFRFMFEIDGQPYLAAPQTPANGSTTLSSFVTLAARA